MKTEEFEEIDEKKLEECCGGGPKTEEVEEVVVEVKVKVKVKVEVEVEVEVVEEEKE